MKVIIRIETFLHFFVGVGAFFGGLMATLFPENPMGMPSDVLESSPFDNFLVPGLFLMLVLGLINILCGFVNRKKRGAPYLNGIMGAILVAWIVIQCMILWGVVFLHILFFFIGVIQGSLALAQLYHRDLFPMDFFKALLGR